MKRVAIQGGLGAYHGIAAEQFFANEKVEIIPCITFRDIFKTIKSDPTVVGIMAIENTIAGSLLPNYELLKEYKYSVVGEHKLRISHCLAALPGQNIHDIKEVQSHPIALMQCTEYLNSLPNIKVVEHEDTALAARDIAAAQTKGMAAICSERAAEIYGLEILAKGIETNKHNFTRFLVFGEQWVADDVLKEENINKASIVFSLPHAEGSLSKVLSVFSFYDINLTKIQSLPIIGREWEYQFYVDFKFNDHERYQQSLVAIKPLIKELKTLGEYAEAKTPAI
jgi:prephenate dehydratase